MKIIQNLLTIVFLLLIHAYTDERVYTDKRKLDHVLLDLREETLSCETEQLVVNLIYIYVV